MLHDVSPTPKNSADGRHRRDADYYPRVFSLLLDQLEICAKEDNATNFVTSYKEEDRVVDLIGAHEFILRIWEKWDRDGKIRKFRIIPEKYWDSQRFGRG